MKTDKAVAKDDDELIQRLAKYGSSFDHGGLNLTCFHGIPIKSVKDVNMLLERAETIFRIDGCKCCN